MATHRLIISLLLGVLVLAGLAGCGGYGANKDANLNKDRPVTPSEKKTVQ